MRQFVYDSWNSVMDMDKNPLRHIPDLQTRHMVLQILAWMWATTFALWMEVSMHLVFLPLHTWL